MDALKAVVKNPSPFYVIIDQYYGKRHGSSDSGEQISPLYICVAQRLYRVLKSPKREASEKRSLLLFFMASFVRAVCLIQDPLGFSDLLLCVLSSGQGSDSDRFCSRKRRAYSHGLDAECWGLDGANIDMFNAFSNLLLNLSGVSDTSKKRKSERPIMNLDGRDMGELRVEMHPLLSYFPLEASPDVTLLHEIGRLKRLVFQKDSQCTIDNVSHSIKEITRLAEGRAQNLDEVAEQFLGFASEPFWRSIFGNLSTYSFEAALMILKSMVDLVSVNFKMQVAYRLPQLPLINICKLASDTQGYFRDEIEFTAMLRICDLLYEILTVEHKKRVQMYLGEYLERVKSIAEYKLQHVLNLCKKVLSECLSGTHAIASKIVEIWNSQIVSESNLNEEPGWRSDFLLAQIYSEMNFQRLCEDLPTHVSDKLLSRLFEIPNILSSSYISSIIMNGHGREKSMIFLLQAMEMAKLERNLYKRRLSLIKICTIADALLQTSKQNSERDIQPLRESLFGPLVSFFTSSKTINADDGSGKQLEFSIGHYGILLLEEFLKSDESDETISMSTVEKLIVQIDQVNSGSLAKPFDPLSPSVVDKLHCACLLIKKACAVETNQSARLKWEKLACRTSILAIRMICRASKMKGDAPFSAQKAANKLLSYELGDCIANLSNSSREAPFFQDVLLAVHSQWLQVLITSKNDNPEFWSSLRRFEASLLPEEDSVIISKDATVLVNMYNSISNAFLQLVTNDFILGLLRNAENSPPPLSRNACQVSLPVTSVLTYHNSVQSESYLGKAIGDASQVKLQICELIETCNDFMLVLEENIEGIGQEHLVREAQYSVLNGIQALIPYLLASYGASLSPTDVAMWSLLQSLNKRVCFRSDKKLDVNNQLEHSLWALFHGPLSLHR